MCKDEIIDELSKIKAKIDCMGQFKSEAGENVDFGFYLVMSGISEELGILSINVDKLGDETSKKLSELFEATK